MSTPQLVQTGLLLPLSTHFHHLMLTLISDTPPHQHPITAITLNFRDNNYHPENGGFHPVEIRLIHHSQQWHIDYVTDFRYMGHPFPELEKDVDISWSQRYCYLSASGDISPEDAADFWSLWETNFLSYYAMGVYTDTITWES